MTWATGSPTANRCTGRSTCGCRWSPRGSPDVPRETPQARRRASIAVARRLPRISAPGTVDGMRARTGRPRAATRCGTLGTGPERGSEMVAVPCQAVAVMIVWQIRAMQTIGGAFRKREVGPMPIAKSFDWMRELSRCSSADAWRKLERMRRYLTAEAATRSILRARLTLAGPLVIGTDAFGAASGNAR